MKSPAQIAAAYETAGCAKTKLKFGKTSILGIMAGALIALGGLGSQIASVCAPDPSTGRLISSVVFPIGLFMVIIGGAELFTGNCLIIVPVLTKKATLKGKKYLACLNYYHVALDANINSAAANNDKTQ